MINQLRGKISYSSEKYIIIDVMGVGFKVFMSADSIFQLGNKIGEETVIWTYLSVKEDSLDLYGFIEKNELEFFEKIISVSGIGPKKGLGIISVAPVETLKKAISSKDLSYLTQVSGIGKKNAEKIVLELKDKMGEISEEMDENMLKEDSDVVLAVRSLGYSSPEIRDAVKKLPKNVKGVSEKVKLILKELGK